MDKVMFVKGFSSSLVCALGCLLLIQETSANKQRWGKIQRPFTFRDPISEYTQYWRIGGSCEVKGDHLAFTPTAQKRSGYVWNNQPVGMTSWEVTVEFSVSGTAPVNTGEGLAFWHVSDPGVQGEVYGHSDTFHGLGIFFDSFDSDGDGFGEPYVLAMYNDGTKPIDAEGAGVQLGVCFSDYRNLPYPARARIAYTPDNGGHLTVGLDISNSGKFKSCISVKEVHLRPQAEYFGLTVSDYGNNFDVFTFLGVDTSERYEPGMGSNSHHTEDAVVPDDSDFMNTGASSANQPPLTAAEEHEHNEIINKYLAELDEKLFVIEDEFGKQFASVFHSHNNNFQHYLSNVLQLDLNDKHAGTLSKINQLSQTVDTIRNVLGELRLQLDSSSNPDSNSNGANVNANTNALKESITQVTTACVDDANRGQKLVAQLKESVANLKTKQEEALTSVHQNLQQTQLKASAACGGGEGVAVMVGGLVAGALVGFGMAVFVKKQALQRF